MTAPAALLVLVTEVTVEAEPHVAAAALLVVVALVVGVVGVGCADGTHLALVSGRQDKCKALCSCLGPSSKPRLKGTWGSTRSKGNN